MKSIVLKVDETVYSTRIMGEKHEILKDNGSVPKIYDDNYWEWWKKKVSYLDEKCDVLTIYSDDLEIDRSLNQDKTKEWSSIDVTELLGELQRMGIPLEFDSYDSENQILKLEVDGKIKEFGTNKKIKFVKKEKQVIEKRKKIIAPAPKGSLKDYYLGITKEYTKG